MLRVWSRRRSAAREPTAPSCAPPASRRARGVLAYLALNPGPHAARPARRALLARRARRVGPHEPARRAERAAARARPGGRSRRRDPRDRRARRRGLGRRAPRSTPRCAAAIPPRRSRRAARRSSTASTTTGPTRRAARTPSGWRRRSSGSQRSADPAEAVRLTREQVALDPLAEEPNRRLIERLAAAGDRAAALGAGKRFAERLRTQLAIAPSRETRALIESLQRARGHSPPRSRCPRYDTAFVGRAAELERLRAAWAGVTMHRRRRIVLIAGEPGVGKTRLAAPLRARGPGARRAGAARPLLGGAAGAPSSRSPRRCARSAPPRSCSPGRTRAPARATGCSTRSTRRSPGSPPSAGCCW